MKIILVDAWNTFVTAQGINHEILTLLDTYSHRKIIVTNANEEEMEKFGIVNMPYEVFSLAHQPNKTDTAYFEALVKQFNCTLDQLIYFEHNQEAVNAARAIGITSLWFPPGESIEKLSLFLEQNL